MARKPPPRLSAARSRLVERNAGLVYAMAHSFVGLGVVGFDDLASEGQFALCNAARCWRQRGRFSTYATVAIKRAMARRIRMATGARTDHDHAPDPCDLAVSHDVSQDPDTRTPIPEETDRLATLRAQVESLLSRLSTDEADALRLRFGLDGRPDDSRKVERRARNGLAKLREIVGEADPLQ